METAFVRMRKEKAITSQYGLIFFGLHGGYKGIYKKTQVRKEEQISEKYILVRIND